MITDNINWINYDLLWKTLKSEKLCQRRPSAPSSPLRRKTCWRSRRRRASAAKLWSSWRWMQGWAAPAGASFRCHGGDGGRTLGKHWENGSEMVENWKTYGRIHDAIVDGSWFGSDEKMWLFLMVGGETICGSQIVPDRSDWGDSSWKTSISGGPELPVLGAVV